MRKGDGMLETQPVEQNNANLDELVSPVLAAMRRVLTVDFLTKQNSARIFHGRGRCYPLLSWCTIDAYSRFILITLFQVPPKDWEDNLGSALRGFFSQINSQVSEDKTLLSVLLQRRYIANAPVEPLLSTMPENAVAVRDDLHFKLSFSQQNVGYFLDIEPARVWLENLAKGKRILNLFAYTCAFSVVAKAAGAESIVNIDMNRRSLATGQDNHKLNNLPLDGVKFLPHDIFKSWGKLKKMGPYDIVIIDPPSFQKGSFIATTDYQKIVRRMPDLVADGGCFLACLNAPEILLSDFKAELDVLCEQGSKQFSCTEILPVHSDFPEAEEGRSLKMLVYKPIASNP
ncbi:MAG: 23S rRNA (cytosine1962-C5)-methyltransferase [Lentisphaeria bacterium]|jgi:23S rRNA (cytosine1962-C5)-methyltransferase